jgi:hypothetical protein
MEVTGKIKVIGKTETYGEFTKANLVLVTDEQYPQTICIEFVKDKIEIMKKYKLDDNVKVSVNIRGREWIDPQGNTKYFTSLQGWRIELDEGVSNVQQAAKVIDAVFEPAGDLNEVDDDLPF